MKRSRPRASRESTAKTGSPLGHLAVSLHANWRRHIKRLRRCRKKLTKRAVHRSRVQARRLISQLELLRGFILAKELKKARRLLKRHHAVFRDLRDTQIQIALLEELPGELAGATAFADWLRQRKLRAKRKACRAIKRAKTRRLRNQLAAFEKELLLRAKKTPHAGSLRTLRRTIDRAFERVAQRDRCVDAMEPKSVHRVRVALKRLVYMIETLPPGLSGITGQRRQALGEWTSKMGKIQDLEVLLAALAKFERKPGAGVESMRVLRDAVLHRRAELIQDYMSVRSSLSDFRPAP